MRLECERCRSAYTIDDDQLGDQPVGAQCPFCRHVQVVQSRSASSGSGYGAQELVLESHSYSESIDPSDILGSASIDAEDDLNNVLDDSDSAILQLGSRAEFARKEKDEAEISPRDVEVHYCGECGLVLTEPFDQVLGLCETHQKGKQEQDLKGTVGVDHTGWYAQLRGGKRLGPISLDDIRARVRVGNIPLSANFSRDGEVFESIHAFRELGYLASLKLDLAKSPKQRHLPFFSRISMIFAPLLVIGGLGSGGYIAWEKRQQVIDIYRDAVASEVPSVPEKASPLRRFLAQWARESSDSIAGENLLSQARTLQDQDRWPAYNQSELLYKRALVTNEHHPEVLAGYVENFALWRYSAASVDERSLMRRVLAHAQLIDANSGAVHRAAGTFAWISGDLNGCRVGADTALQQDKTDERAKVLQASCYLEGNPALAISEVSQIRTKNPNLKRAERVLADAYRRQGRYAEAYAALEHRLKDEASNAILHLAYGQLDQALGRYDRAQRRYLRASRLPGDRQWALLLRGMLLLRQQRLSMAVEAFGRAEKAGPLAPERGAMLYADWARAALSRGNISRALRLAEQAVKFVPHDLGSLVVLGEAQLAIGDISLASQTARRVLTSRMDDVDHPVALVLAGRVASAEGNVGEALQHMRTAMHNSPKDQRLVTILASEYLRNGQASQAYATMRKVVEFEPFHWSDEGDRMALSLGRQVMLDALAQFQRSAKNPRNASVAHSAAAILQIHLGREVEAEQSVHRALVTDDANVLALILKTYFAAQGGAWNAVEKAANAVLLVERGNAVAHLYRARAHSQRGDKAEARDDYLAALRSQPGLLIAEVELALLNHDSVTSEQIRPVLEKALSLNPTSIRIRQLCLEYTENEGKHHGESEALR
ncbi:MAG: zinc-ribbon domain-containing protein [Myxococcales bacterium]|nr:zinc-ribbon domain-containing protein [Myxococcales bacterium]